MTDMQTKIVLLRRFNDAAVEIKVSAEGIELSISMADFLAAVAGKATERLANDVAVNAGSPVLLMTTRALKDRLLHSVQEREVFQTLWNSADEVLSEVKKASVVAQ
jgi:hypothetical protein